MNSQRIRLFISLLTWAVKASHCSQLESCTRALGTEYSSMVFIWRRARHAQKCNIGVCDFLTLLWRAHQIVMTRGLPPMLGAAGAHSRRQCRHLSTPLGLHVSCQNSWVPCAPLPACSHESSIRCVSHVRIQPGCTSNLDRLQGCVLLVRVDRTHVRHHLHAAMQSWVSHQASLKPCCLGGQLAARGRSLLLKCKGD